MAALTRPTTANYEVHENVRVDTSDNEDHTFCGIMFPIVAKSDLPVSRLVIRSFAVRGWLGPLSVWVSNDDVTITHLSDPDRYSVSNLHRIREDATRWTKVYEKEHEPSRRKYATLDFSNNPIVMVPGQMKAIYIHSGAPNDLGIVYDNSHSMRSVRYSDAFISILSGAAHLSPDPFHSANIWGWGSAWRDYREFVGRVDFGAVYQLWNPDLHSEFGNNFQRVTETLLACQRRAESPVSMLPDECIYYILNMCRWDWFEDDADQVSAQRRQRSGLLFGRKRQRAPTEGAAGTAQTEAEPCASERRVTRSQTAAARANGRWRRLGLIGGIREKILNSISSSSSNSN